MSIPGSVYSARRYRHGRVQAIYREMRWVARLTRACEENRLELYYQPIVPIGNNRDPRGHYELLVRMRDENGELVLPAEFIPAAERYNVMPMIDRWVVSQALGTLAHYRTDGDARHGYTITTRFERILATACTAPARRRRLRLQRWGPLWY